MFHTMPLRVQGEFDNEAVKWSCKAGLMGTFL